MRTSYDNKSNNNTGREPQPNGVQQRRVAQTQGQREKKDPEDLMRRLDEASRNSGRFSQPERGTAEDYPEKGYGVEPLPVRDERALEESNRRWAEPIKETPAKGKRGDGKRSNGGGGKKGPNYKLFTIILMCLLLIVTGVLVAVLLNKGNREMPEETNVTGGRSFDAVLSDVKSLYRGDTAIVTDEDLEKINSLYEESSKLKADTGNVKFDSILEELDTMRKYLEDRRTVSQARNTLKDLASEGYSTVIQSALRSVNSYTVDTLRIEMDSYLSGLVKERSDFLTVVQELTDLLDASNFNRDDYAEIVSKSLPFNAEQITRLLDLCDAKKELQSAEGALSKAKAEGIKDLSKFEKSVADFKALVSEKQRLYNEYMGIVAPTESTNVEESTEVEMKTETTTETEVETTEKVVETTEKVVETTSEEGVKTTSETETSAEGSLEDEIETTEVAGTTAVDETTTKATTTKGTE